MLECRLILPQILFKEQRLFLVSPEVSNLPKHLEVSYRFSKFVFRPIILLFENALDIDVSRSHTASKVGEKAYTISPYKPEYTSVFKPLSISD